MRRSLRRSFTVLVPNSHLSLPELSLDDRGPFGECPEALSSNFDRAFARLDTDLREQSHGHAELSLIGFVGVGAWLGFFEVVTAQFDYRLNRFGDQAGSLSAVAFRQSVEPDRI